MPTIDLSLSGNVFLFIAALLAILLFSIFTYRVTVPPISRSLKSILITLRVSSLTLLILLLFDPLLSIIRQHSLPPMIGVLIDDSQSMQIVDNGERRSESIRKFLDSESFRELKSLGDVRFGAFGSNVKVMDKEGADSLFFGGERTDIYQALKFFKEKTALNNLQSIVLLSDGIITSGESPLLDIEEFETPLFTIGIGDTVEKKDLLVRKVLVNEVSYVGDRIPVVAIVKNTGYKNDNAEVILESDGVILDRKLIALNSDEREYRIPLSFVAKNPGKQKLTVSVSEMRGEEITRNNRYPFFVTIHKSKMKVLLIAGAPSADMTFVRRALGSDANIDLDVIIEREGGGYYEGEINENEFRNSECIVLVGFPSRTSDQKIIQEIIRGTRERKGLFVLLSRTIDFQKIKEMEEILPFSIQTITPDEYQAFISVRNSPKSVLLFGLRKESLSPEKWSSLPPLFKHQALIRSKPESEIVAHVRLQTSETDEPLVVIRNSQGKKSLAVLGYGIWRWKMYADGLAGSKTLTEEFLSNSIRWLTTREDEKRIRVNPSKEVFSEGEPIDFTAQAYDDNLNPIENANIELNIKDREKQYTLSLDHITRGQYEGMLAGIPEGEYNYEARVKIEDQLIGTDSGRFNVGGLNAEFIETRMNRNLLRQLAERSGGKYFDADEWGQLREEIKSLPKFLPETKREEARFPLWNLPWVYAAIVLLLAVEWFIRKRTGML